MCNHQMERAHSQLRHELRQLDVFPAVKAACKGLEAAGPQCSSLQSRAEHVQGFEAAVGDGATVPWHAPDVLSAEPAAARPLKPLQEGLAAPCKAEEAARQALRHLPLSPTRFGVRVGAPLAAGAPLGRAALHGAAAHGSPGSASPRRCPTCGRVLGDGQDHADAGCDTVRSAAADALARAPEGTRRLAPEICAVYLMVCRQAIQDAVAQLLAVPGVAPDVERGLRALPALLRAGGAGRGSSLVEDEVAILEQQLGKLVVLDGEADGRSSEDSHGFSCRC